MTQRRKSQSVGLLLTVVFSAVVLWALAAVAWPVPVVYADEPEIITITVTSSLETYFYDPGLDPTGGTVYFNSVGGEGAGQVLTVTVTCSGTIDGSTFEGAPAFGDTPPLDTSAPWQVTYTLEAGVGTQSGIVFTVTNTITETDTAVITFTQDHTEPTILSPTLDETSNFLHADGLTLYYGDDMTTTVAFSVEGEAQDDGSGLYQAAYSEAFGDTPPSDPLTSTVAWSGDYNPDATDWGNGTITVTVSDQVGNSATQTFTYTRDTISPTIVPIAISETSPYYLHADDLTLYYSNLMTSPEDFEVQGTASDDGAGFRYVTFPLAFGEQPGNDINSPWSGSYDVVSSDSGSDNIVVTAYDNVGNWSTGVFTYIEDITNPTVEFTDVTNPGYDSANGELDDDGSNWYDPDNLSAGWYFTYTATDTSSDLALANASWDHSNYIYDQPINNPGLDGDGVFNGVDDDGDGMVTVTLTITDNVGNSANDTVVFNLDNTGPTVISPAIVDFASSPYLHVVDDLTIFYGDDMGPSLEDFEVQGDAEDAGVGPYQAIYPLVFGEQPLTDTITLSPHSWSGIYDVGRNDCCDGTINVTITDRLGNATTQIFTYTRDVLSPTLSGPFTIVETSDYLHTNGTTVYYSHQMGGTAQSFTVQGNADDNGAGLYRASFSPALGSSPGYDYTPDEWSGTYNDVESSDNGDGTITVRVYDNVSNWSQQTFNYIEDTTAPTVELTNVTDPGHDFGGGELDTNGSNWYNAGDFTAGGGGGWAFTSDTNDGSGAGLDMDYGTAVWDHSANQTDRTLDCGSDGDGTFSSVSGDGDGTVTVTVIITDNVGNSANDTVVFNIDNTTPTITSPYISEGSPHLYADGLTIYYGDEVVGLEGFRVGGNAQDSGVGLEYVAYSAALGESYHEDPNSPESWSRDYTVEQGDNESGVITATVYDWLGNFATQLFTYIHDADRPTSVASSPQYDNGGPIVVTYSNATDTGGSGLRWVQLWYKKDSGTWDDSGLSPQTGPSGSFNFIPNQGDGTYYFASVATDKAGNQETTPTGSGDDQTIYDTTKPTVPGNFHYLPDNTDNGSDGFLPESGYYDNTEIQLRWNASTDVGSGLLPTNPYHLGTAPHPTSGRYAEDSPYTVPGSGTYNIYLTAEDKVGNISNDAVTGQVIVDTQAPQGDINCPISTTEFSFIVGWSATDQGPAGLRSTDPYSVAYNVDGGGWQNWFTATSALTATFGPTSPITVEYGHTYCFRLRAVDKAGNVQYTHGDDCTEVRGPNIQKVFLPIIAKPDPNWGFETGDFTSWDHGGELAQSVSTAMPYSGSYSALLGSRNYGCIGVPVGSAWLRRSVTVPSSGSPTLSFQYRMVTQDKTDPSYLDVLDLDTVPSGDLFEVRINSSRVFTDANSTVDVDRDNCTETSGTTTYDSGWTRVVLPLDAYTPGQTIQIIFYNYNRPDIFYNTYTYVDDVSVE